MYYSNIKPYDVANGNGIRVSLFVSGCRNNCKGCFNLEAQKFNNGYEYTIETEEEIINLLDKHYVQGLTLLGGEPFEPENQMGLLSLVKKIKNKFPNKNIWAYTGYTLEKILSIDHPNCSITNEFLSYIDVLVDGKFIEELKDISLKFKGSSNQRVIDIPKTITFGIVLELK